jgi:hypothetical protein
MSIARSSYLWFADTPSEQLASDVEAFSPDGPSGGESSWLAPLADDGSDARHLIARPQPCRGECVATSGRSLPVAALALHAAVVPLEHVERLGLPPAAVVVAPAPKNRVTGVALARLSACTPTAPGERATISKRKSGSAATRYST